MAAANREPWIDWMRGSSVWKGPVLALLLDSPGYPYEISTRLWQRLGPAWRRRPKDNVYKLLEEAESLGLAYSTMRASSVRGPQRVYEATDKTSEAVDFWMEQPLPAEPSVRSVLTTRMMLSHERHIPLVHRALDEYESLLVDWSREYDTPYPTDSYVGLERELARKAVVAQVTAWLDWVEYARATLRDFAARRRA